LADQRLIKIGVISGLFGVNGWLKIFSFTEPKENILNYKQWLIVKSGDEKTVSLNQGRLHGKTIIAQLENINDREQAAGLLGYEAYISRDQLPELPDGEFYWSDLIGLHVENLTGVGLGTVDSLFETGANDVLVVKGKREHAIPFIQGQVIKSIDLTEHKLVVDWDEDF
jgi:16S rRNA processing protein RimM